MNIEKFKLNCPECGHSARISATYGILISPEEIHALKDYFLKRAGYLSREFDEALFPIIKRLEEFK